MKKINVVLVIIKVILLGVWIILATDSAQFLSFQNNNVSVKHKLFLLEMIIKCRV